MSKVYLIGAHVEPEHIARIRQDLSIPENAQVVCVSNIEDIPIEDRVQQIAEVHSFKASPMLEIPQINWERKDNKKGHERPYKFHK